MTRSIYQVDSFTTERFKGNPAGVCLLERPAAAQWMQAVAHEMNISETAFLDPTDDGFNLRWFTPAVEVDLCGHATLASAHILWETNVIGPDRTARFHTRSGVLSASRDGDIIEMDFPADPEQPVEPPVALLESLGVDPVYVGRTGYNYLVEVASEAEVMDTKPDFAKLESLGLLGSIVTSRADSDELDFVSRFFAPSAGINEDPVTGSAHCSLGPYWGAKLNKTELAARQVSSRGGDVRVRLAGDRVLIGGQAGTGMAIDLL